MREWGEQKPALRMDTLSHRQRKEGALKGKDMIKGQKADICGVCPERTLWMKVDVNENTCAFKIRLTGTWEGL